MYRSRLLVLALLFAIAAVAFMTVGARGSWSFILPFRGAKLATLCVIAVAISTSTVLFQTITQNRILTPSIMGFDALFILLLTMGVFVLGLSGATALPEEVSFAVSLVTLIAASLALFGTLLTQNRVDLTRMILTGLVLSVLFRSLTSFAVRMMDPNEYAVVQVSSYARFTQVNTDLLAISTALIGAVLIAAWRMRHALDVISLGREIAVDLGEDPKRRTLQVLILVSILVSVSTALVGPVAFLGLLVVSIAHLITPTAHHAVLLTTSGLVAAITLVGGQTLMERVLGLSTPLTVVINVIGGATFLILLFRGAKQ